MTLGCEEFIYSFIYSAFIGLPGLAYPKFHFPSSSALFFSLDISLSNKLYILLTYLVYYLPSFVKAGTFALLLVLPLFPGLEQRLAQGGDSINTC